MAAASLGLSYAFHSTKTTLKHATRLFATTNAKSKRKQLLGLAKAVDRGQYAFVYQPRPFVAQSGLPDKDPFVVLGIESSCDDTGAAIVTSDGRILGQSLASQGHLHEEWGGVVPGLAQEAHERELEGVVQQALDEAGLKMEEVDAVGVTVGPGLEICLRVGATYAAQQLPNKPFVGVHHLEAHILMVRLVERDVEFPFLALLVSGGHCQLIECRGIGDYTILGGTLDDSLGETFDKTARLLGLPVGGGGGPAVEQLALDGDPTQVALPVPLQSRKDLDFSFAGLKTAVRKAAEKLCVERGVEDPVDLPHQDKANIAASFQNVSIRHLEQRLKYALAEVEGTNTLAVVGGVAANQLIRSRLEALCQKHQWRMVVPPPKYCTDQGAMSAWAAVERLKVGSSDVPRADVYARYPFAASSSTSDSCN